jgi:hypothetical protein
MTFILAIAMLMLVLYPVAMALADTDLFADGAGMQHALFVLGVNSISIASISLVSGHFDGQFYTFHVLIFLIVMGIVDLARLSGFVGFMDQGDTLFYIILFARYLICIPIISLGIQSIHP